jgi:3',5'-cyclic AMP phosphodiesterase CpdA
VFSDLHYYDTALGDSGRALQRALKNDRKLLIQSREILDQAIREVAAEDADFLIVCGDLTKDGETINHQGVKQALTRIARTGKKVYVIPGNHDIANGHAVRYQGSEKIPVETITGGDFPEMYREFGYGQALYRDPDSLSYVAEPIDGLWLLALDSCRWKENLPDQHAHADGAFSNATLQWMEEVLIKARQADKAVIGMMHHGILEHYPGNEKYFPMYLVKDHAAIAEMLAHYGVSLMFTGHFHAQDITARRFAEQGRPLYDIETGSLITWPSPYRIVTIRDNQQLDIESRFITSISSRPDDFFDFSKQFLYTSTLNLTDRALKRYWVSKEDRKTVAPEAARAYAAHLAGDEQRPASILDTDSLGLWGSFIMWMRRDLIEAWYTDLPPSDNTVTIDLKTGQYISDQNTPGG